MGDVPRVHHPADPQRTLLQARDVPAFDTYFRRGIGTSGFRPAGMRKVHDYWQRNSELIERHRVRTLDFDSGGHTARRYTQAKVIDMIFFIEGANRSM